MWTLLWLVPLSISFFLDRSIAQFMQESGLATMVKEHRLAAIVKLPGHFLYTAILATLLAACHRLKWRAGLLLLLSGLAPLANLLVKWGFGRIRPYKAMADMPQPAPFLLQPFRGGLPGIFDQANLAFPSGHSSVAFATAAALAILLPKWRAVFYATAGLVAAERVAASAHYLSDVVAAAGLSVLGVHLIRQFWLWLLDPCEVEPATWSGPSKSGALERHS